MRSKQVLTLQERWQLTNYVKEHYASAKLSDPAFALHAAGVLGLPHVNANHVAGCRKVLGMAPFMSPRGRHIQKRAAQGPQSTQREEFLENEPEFMALREEVWILRAVLMRLCQELDFDHPLKRLDNADLALCENDHDFHIWLLTERKHIMDMGH